MCKDDDLIRRCGGTFPRGEGEGRARQGFCFRGAAHIDKASPLGKLSAKQPDEVVPSHTVQQAIIRQKT